MDQNESDKVIEYRDDKEYSQRVWFSCLGEPNDAGNNEDCARLETNGLWQDISCIGYLYGSICEVGKYRNFSSKTVSDKTDF